MKFTDVADFYFFHDWFGTKNDNNIDFCKQLQFFDNKILDMKNWTFIKLNINIFEQVDYPIMKIWLHITWNEYKQLDISLFKKLLFSFHPNQFVTYTINQKNIIKQFKSFAFNVHFSFLSLSVKSLRSESQFS